MDNLYIYNASREVPQEAQKVIAGGRLKGFTEINPMWRIKKLTELFGVCGIGWYTEIVKYWIDDAAIDGSKVANMLIRLYIKVNGEWSKPIEGIGGTLYISNEKKGLYINEDCYKMAYTDAISVACKSLGIGADIYFDKDCTKHTIQEQQSVVKKNKLTEAMLDKDPAFCDTISEWLMKIANDHGGVIDVEAVLKQHYEIHDTTIQRINAIFNNFRMNRQ